jgi:diadenylate cyclase
VRVNWGDWTLGDILRTSAEVVILGMVIYAFFRFLQQTRGSAVLKGFVVVVVLFILGFMTLVRTAGLERLKWIADRGLQFILVGLIIVFQPELRQALVSLGESRIVRAFAKRHRRSVTEELVQAAGKLSRAGLGAIILVERGDGIAGYAEGATKIDADLSAALLVTIFTRDTPLHDGATLVRGNRIVAAGCLLPLSQNPNLSQALGTRHRAALGAAEESDCLAMVVSEETRRISIAQRGQLELGVSLDRLREVLDVPPPPEVKESVPAAEPTA